MMKRIFFIILLGLFFLQTEAQLPANVVLQPINYINDVQIYPNPTFNPYFYVNSNQIIKTIEVIDLVGKTVVKKEFTSYYSDKILIELPTSSRKGMYLVKVTFDDNSSVIKKLMYK